VVVLVSVVTLFWFHDSSDSFLAQNGPMTAMRAARQALTAKLGIMTVAFVAILSMAIMRCWLFSRIRERGDEKVTQVKPLDPAIRI
jgi:flagellar biogenesis protein FliO